MACKHVSGSGLTRWLSTRLLSARSSSTRSRVAGFGSGILLFLVVGNALFPGGPTRQQVPMQFLDRSTSAAAVAADDSDNPGQLGSIDLPCVRERPTPITSVLEGVALARSNDARCGPPESLARLCRALFVAAQTDPVRSFGSLGAVDATMLEAHEWALNEGLASSSGDLAVAFRILQGSLAALPVGDERALARWVSERARSTVIEPLEAAENVCNTG